MKWHRNLFEGIVEGLSRILKRNEPADAAAAYLFRKYPRWGKRDRAFVKDKLFELVRRRNLWERLARRWEDLPPERGMPLALILASEEEVPPYVEKYLSDREAVRSEYGELIRNPLFRYGLPEWLDRKGRKSWHERWEEIARDLNRPNLPVIRINTLKISPDQMSNRLSEEGYAFSRPGFPPESVVFAKPYALEKTPWYRRGWFEFQDLSSQEVGHFAEIGPGMTVIDACAGAGGKTLHAAALMENRGELYAFDISPAKIAELRRRARRAGVKNLVRADVVTPRDMEGLEGKADVVLVDAPCSGSGTWKRKPHLKWKFDPAAFERIRNTQRHVLDTYARWVKPGGKLVYVTCSVLEDENRRQVEDFLKRNKDFTFVEDKHILPGPGRDGFYMAKLQRS
ncbi:MAG: RsmB/NOP family class I SAM-dependent RNA methyltransferase [Chlorobi bacterium]|nr:RsmB/NOP family class I SAM-dependent RNA methyltransferase [Chlorobiota bacterium]